MDAPNKLEAGILDHAGGWDLTRDLSGEVALAVSDGGVESGPLFPEELASLGQAVPKRVAEFRDGRSCARRALAELGVAPGPILREKSRAPIWPAGYVGSISHCADLCAAAAARCGTFRSIGIDVEKADPIEVRLSWALCTDSELDGHRRLPLLETTSWLNLAFSAKEAFFKCYFPIGGTFIDFDTAEIEFLVVGTAPNGRFRVRAIRAAAELAEVAENAVGAWAVRGAHVYAAAALPAKSLRKSGPLQ